MNANSELFSLYDQWRLLTEEEGQAIRQGQWHQVNRRQKLKRDLQGKIIQAAESWQASWPQSETSRVEYDRQFRPILAELITMESRNHELISARHDRSQAEIGGLDQSARHLRGLQRAYGSADQGRWHSYS